MMRQLADMIGRMHHAIRTLVLMTAVMATLPAVAAESAALNVDLAPDVVYCNAQWPGDKELLANTLKAGIAVTFIWNITVEEVNRYWINENIADIQITRSVKPDLLSQTLLLEDATAGISRRVVSIDEAVKFLVQLDQFPVLDRSLLVQEITYRMSVEIEKHEGEIEQGWWSRIVSGDDFSMRLDFQLP